ncbi:MAG: FAD-binding protein [Armatimonadetes bacterium]|nr:FAD-binding protein [Armatimonadota bacterium]
MSGPAASRVYDCDAYTVKRHHPHAVVFPRTTEEVQKVVRWCLKNEIPFTPRGAGTGLSGGALAACGGVVIATTKMRRILEIDLKNRVMLAQAGCPNLRLTRAVEEHGLHFAPDPSSQTVCTLGGNICENSGGPHTLKYGVTADHVLGITLVDAQGEVRQFGGKVGGFPGLDLIGVVVGSEGTFGVVTEAWVRLTPLPSAVRTLLAAFPTPRDATETVSEVIASGIIPAAMEFMDGSVIEAVEAAFHTGLPTDAGALLLVECDAHEGRLASRTDQTIPNEPNERRDTTDDAEARVVAEIERVEAIAREHGAMSVQLAEDEDARAKLWTARKKGIGALGRLAPTIVTHDGVIPRSKLPEVLDFTYRIAKEKGIRVANIFHAGDGNLHPIFLFDDRDPKQVKAVVEAGEAVLRRCIAEGGSVSGEHGIGVEKIDLLAEMFSKEDLRMQEKIRKVFNSGSLCNPGKILPSQKSCVEVRLRHKGIAT